MKSNARSLEFKVYNLQLPVCSSCFCFLLAALRATLFGPNYPFVWLCAKSERERAQETETKSTDCAF